MAVLGGGGHGRVGPTLDPPLSQITPERSYVKLVTRNLKIFILRVKSLAIAGVCCVHDFYVMYIFFFYYYYLHFWPRFRAGNIHHLKHFRMSAIHTR